MDGISNDLSFNTRRTTMWDYIKHVSWPFSFCYRDCAWASNARRQIQNIICLANNTLMECHLSFIHCLRERSHNEIYLISRHCSKYWMMQNCKCTLGEKIHLRYRVEEEEREKGRGKDAKHKRKALQVYNLPTYTCTLKKAIIQKLKIKLLHSLASPKTNMPLFMCNFVLAKLHVAIHSSTIFHSSLTSSVITASYWMHGMK